MGCLSSQWPPLDGEVEREHYSLCNRAMYSSYIHTPRWGGVGVPWGWGGGAMGTGWYSLYLRENAFMTLFCSVSNPRAGGGALER